ncbi:metalloendoproteinase 1-like [Salvia miltiorrhiza]|uniref:metalloendoproteinase 1-like n=1 Tax=Salvia miltiorrhiza TaxID=226208 RepID=UPI0025ABB409|nr:metalloendoproteinase 1-like [Salvia miltiorrhiza]
MARETTLLFLLLCSSSLASPHHHYSAMDFLQPLLGTQKGNLTQGLSKLKNHLSRLGYLTTIHKPSSSSPPPHDDLFDGALQQAVTDYQSFFSLPPTGALDAATLAHMGKPRCGVRDVSPPNTTAHYTFFPGQPKWPAGRRNLTYSFPPGTRADAHKAILDATNIWASVSPLKFRYTKDYSAADIKISFQSRDHGDGSAFDGSGGILAHAYAPTDGRLHFDGDERWVDGVVGGAFDLQTVGLHELGHVLGLGHSQDGGAVMFPQVGNGFRKVLGKDDIDGIRALYSS